MEIKYQVVVLDSADLDAVSSFWAAVLGGTVDAEDDWHMVIDRDGTPGSVCSWRPTTSLPNGPMADSNSRSISTCGLATSAPPTTR